MSRTGKRMTKSSRKRIQDLEKEQLLRNQSKKALSTLRPKFPAKEAKTLITFGLMPFMRLSSGSSRSTARLGKLLVPR
jgi:hypothetical protein